MKLHLSTITRGYLLLFTTSLFLILLTLFSLNGLKPITESRIEDAEQRIETLNAKLENASPDETESIKGNLDFYTKRRNMLNSKDKYYISCMAVLFIFMLLSIFYTQKWEAPICAPIAAIILLLGIGLSFQYIFTVNKTTLLSLTLALIAATCVYFVWRRVNDIGDFLFVVLAGLVFLLILINIIFGVEKNGAKLWLEIKSISIQPGEFVKILILMLGALSYKSNFRKAVYFITTFIACAAFIYLKDLGTVIIIFCMLIYMTTKLLNSKVTLTGILCAFLGFAFISSMLPHVAERLTNVGKAMTAAGSDQQTKLLESIIFGGLGGLGFENSTFMINLFAASSDTAIAGLLAIFGLPMLIIVMLSYAAIVILPNRNAPIYPSARFITVQASILITVQVLLNFLGSIDVLPFTGIVAPFISDGGSAYLSFGILSGIVLAAINPSLKRIRGLGA